MSAHSPTPEQAAAIGAAGVDVLLEAGAGTGKTGVMVDRYCRLACEEGVELDEILAFTFTDRAAAELRQRIRAELNRRAAAGEARAAELRGRLGAAWVMTIHGFCNRILGAHPVAAGIDPSFRVLDTPEASRLAREAFETALLEFLADRDPARERLLATLDVELLRATTLRLYHELRSRGEARPRLPEPPRRDAADAQQEAIAAAAEALRAKRLSSSNRDLLELALETLSEIDPPPQLDRLWALRTTTTAKGMAAYREAIEAFVAARAEEGEGRLAYEGLATLLELFGTAFGRAKERRSAVDFEDLQLLAAGLLERTGIGGSFRERFRHLLVDEFQDTNKLQLRLIEALRGPATELVAVGDELQSIYGFRHADLDVFREQRRRMEASPAATTMRLSGNFRSRPEVIGAVNALGGALLGDSYNELRVGAEPAAGETAPEPAVELLLTGRDGWDGEGVGLKPGADSGTALSGVAEARFLAARLADLAAAGVERSRMVVLLRAYTHLAAYEDALGRAGLRPYVVGGRGYWSRQQVADVNALLATIANPLDDQALFGALASPACGASPDALWLLRAAAGRGQHVWPALARAGGLPGAERFELEAPERLAQLPAAELESLRRFAATIEALRERAPRLSLPALIDAAVARTGYDLAVLMRPTGEARFANVRKLQRLAGEFEAREGRDLRGLLDFLAVRAEVDAEPPAATAAEGHDGVRVMTVHSAKGLEFDVVAVPQLGRQLLSGQRAPLVALGREQPPRVGMQMRRLGGRAINLYEYAELCAEEGEREAEEALRLFHVAATRARERLILSGVINPNPGEPRLRTAVIERIVDALGASREEDCRLEVEAPTAREGLGASFGPAPIAVRVNLPSPGRGAELEPRPSVSSETPSEPAPGSPPLIERRPPAVPSRPLSYTAISAYGDCAYRFYMERILGLGERPPSRLGRRGGSEGEDDGTPTAREERSARGAAVHALLEWSADHEWRQPPTELTREHARAAGLDPDDEGLLAELSEPVRGWLGADLRRRADASGVSVRAEVPILLGLGGAVLRGSIDLLVERDGEPPLVIDYKTDRLGGAEPATKAASYEVQRAIYALAVAPSHPGSEVETAYVFLERPDDPVLTRWDRAELARARERLEATVAGIGAGEFPPAPAQRRDWGLCRGCPAVGRLCSGPAPEEG